MSDATAILDNDIEPGDAAENITSKYGRLFVVSGPSGVGKGTVIKQAMSTPVGEKAIVKCVTATTRQPRPGEINNVNYHFFTHSEFQEKIDSGYFV